MLGISERQVYHLCERRELGYVRVGVRGRRIRGVDVAQYLRANHVAPVNEAAHV